MPNSVSASPIRTPSVSRLILVVCFNLSFILWAQADKTAFSFFEKARLHYQNEISADGTLKRGDPTIDSLLRTNTVTHEFNTAYDISWRIGLFLLEQGKHGEALDIYNDLRHQLESKTGKTKEDQKKFSSVLNVIGAIYEETGLWNEALSLYMNSLQVCNAIGFSQGQAKVFNNIGKLYYNRNELNKAEDLFNKAIAINKMLDIRPELFNNYNNLAGIYQMRHNSAKALTYALFALNQLDINKDFYNLSIVYSNIGNLYQDKGNYPVALSYYQQAAAIQEEKSFFISLIRSYLSISSLYEATNNKELTAVYLEKSLKLAYTLGNPSQKLLVLQSAARSSKTAGDFKRAAGYYSSYVRLNDSLVSLNSLTKIEQIQAVYDVINKEKDNKILQQKVNLQQLAIQRQRIVLLTAILIFLSLAFFLVNLQRNRKRERKRNHLIATQSETLHQKEKEILVQKEHTLKLELDYKNRQLTSYALHLARNNEFIAKTSDELKQILLELHPRDKERSERIRQMLSDLQQYSSGNDWEEFRLYFEEVHQSFEKNLTDAFPALSPNDKKICALIKLGLTTKEIASITFRELRSVESARNRLRKKLGLAADVNIQTYLSHF
jgi:tetratricopeptide (TPR) repeat protein